AAPRRPEGGCRGLRGAGVRRTEQRRQPATGEKPGPTGFSARRCSFRELVQCLDGFVELYGLDLRSARVVGAGRVDVAAVLAEGDSLFLLAVVEFRDDRHRRRVEAGLRLRGDEGCRADVGEARQEILDLLPIQI